MFENPRRGRQARNFTTNVPKILVLKSSSEQIFSRKLPLGAPADLIDIYPETTREPHAKKDASARSHNFAVYHKALKGNASGSKRDK